MWNLYSYHQVCVIFIWLLLLLMVDERTVRLLLQGSRSHPELTVSSVLSPDGM